MLTRANKESIVSGLKSDFEKAQAVFLTNLIGVKSNDANAIRKSIRDVKGKVVITRNSLIEIAAKGTQCESILKDLKGPNAVAIAYEDAAAVAKCLKDAGKDNELIELRSGVLDGKDLSVEEVIQLANLPSRDQMLATLLATFMAPTSAFVRVLNSIREQKETEGAA